MSRSHERMEAIVSAAVAFKEMKQGVYASAIARSDESVGREVFRFLHAAEDRLLADLLRRIGALDTEAGSMDKRCSVVPLKRMSSRERLIASRNGRTGVSPEAILAVENAICLKNLTIRFYTTKLRTTDDAAERELLTAMLAEEQTHYKLLADLKSLFANPENVSAGAAD